MTYLLFAGQSYYPDWAWQDFIGKFSSVEEAKNELLSNEDLRRQDWYQIVNYDLLEIEEQGTMQRFFSSIKGKNE